jgi:general secretion pathway protein E
MPAESLAVSTEHPQLLGQYLIRRGLLKPEQLEVSLAEQRITQERLGLILSRNGFISRQTLLEAILATNPQRMAGEQHFTHRVPAEVLLRLQAMVVAETETQVFIGTLSSESQALADLRPYYPREEIVFVAVDHEQLDAYLDSLRQMQTDESSLVEKLLRDAMAKNASDIHIHPRYGSYSVFFRVYGVRHHVHEGSLEEYNTVAARIKDMSKMDLAERRIPQDGSFPMDYDGKLVDMRVATLPAATGEEIVIRILDPDRVQPNLSTLGITGVAQWRAGLSWPYGLCLVCGPTGSGKTTTLNASVREMDRFERAICTAEDPVEYRIPFVKQVSINHTLGVDFARVVRAFMRADPDVIVVGEVRDAETARNAIKAADTGHLVLATLHTGDIRGSVQRLRDLDVPAHELTAQLRAVLVQRLLRRYCPACRGEGCPKCFQSGYLGRTIVSECAYFPSQDHVQRMLHGECWWPTMLQDAVNKWQEGITSKEEVIRVFGEPAVRIIEGIEQGQG